MAMYVLTYLEILPALSRVVREIGRGREHDLAAYRGENIDLTRQTVATLFSRFKKHPGVDNNQPSDWPHGKTKGVTMHSSYCQSPRVENVPRQLGVLNIAKFFILSIYVCAKFHQR